MENVRKFKAAINRSFTCREGILAHGIKDDQLSRYLMAKMQEFSLGVGRELIGSLVIRRQPNPRSVNAEGEFVDDGDPTAVTKKWMTQTLLCIYLMKNCRLNLSLIQNLLSTC